MRSGLGSCEALLTCNPLLRACDIKLRTGAGKVGVSIIFEPYDRRCQPYDQHNDGQRRHARERASGSRPWSMRTIYLLMTLFTARECCALYSREHKILAKNVVQDCPQGRKREHYDARGQFSK